jgi:small-conductance mechanosensitive channel
MIAELERLAAPEAEDPPALSLARRVAVATQGTAERTVERAAELWTGLSRLPERLRSFAHGDFTALVAALGDLVLVAGATIAGFVGLRALARLLYRRMGARYRRAGALARWAIFAAAELVDIGIVVLAWATGYVVAATAVGGFGEVAILHTLYLNAFLVVELVKVVIRLYRLNPEVGRVPTARERTLLALFRNAFTIALIIMAAMLALSQLGVNIAPLLAGAGVLGLAIGFGAQKLVQDIITGAFIQVENAMNEGDVVTAGGTTGVVEKLTIRSVGLRDLDGTYHLIPFSSVDMVSNFMKGFSYHVANVGVAYREDVSEVKELMQKAFDILKETEHGANIIGDFEIHGVAELGDSAVVVRGRIKTLPGTQWR